MINKITSLYNTVKFTPQDTKKQKSSPQNSNQSYSQNPLMDKTFANSYKSYALSFKGQEEDSPLGKFKTKEDVIKFYATDTATDFVNKTRKIANASGQNEINHYHVLKSALIEVASVIKALDEEQVDYDALDRNNVIGLFENYTTDSMFKDKDARKKVKKVVQKKLREVENIIKKLPKEEINPNPDHLLTKGLVSDILAYRQEPNTPIENFHIVNAAIFARNKDDVRKFTNSIIYELNDNLMVETNTLKNRPHFRRYDEKARNIWKNLSLGTNMYITYEPQKTTPQYFIPSLYHVLQNEANGFGSLNAKNTHIVEINTAIKDTYLFEKVKNLAKDKTKTHIIFMYPSNMLVNSGALDEAGRIFFSAEYMNLMKNPPSNVKFVMFDSRDNLYNQLQNSVIQNMYQNFEEASIPVLSTEDVVKEFKEQPLMRKDIKKPFTKGALEKTVEASAMLDGIFPDKTIRLMKKIVSYYIDKREINEKDVAEYVNEAKDLFKKTNDDSSVDIIFDTGKRIKDIIGKDATKKEAMSVVRQIKSNKMGTKGIILYSLDPMAGSGRRFTAQAIAGEAKVPYVEIDANYFGSESVNIFGETSTLTPEAAVKKLFSLLTTQADANPNKAAVLFIDKFDNFILGEYLNRYHQRAMAQLINEMDKAEKAGFNILVAGSISRSQILGEAARNSVKFVDRLEVTTPAFSSKERAEVIKTTLKENKIKLAAKTKEERENIIQSIAMTTNGFPFTYLKNFVKRAQAVALERGHKIVGKDDFTEAYLQISTGRPANRNIEPHEKTIVASHECGHAVNIEVMNSMIKKMGKPWHIPDKVNFITLDPRGVYGGAMYHHKDKNSEQSFERLFSNIVCSYGGNSAEHQFFDIDGSYGISGDLENATYLAEAMVTEMGLGKHTGKIHIDTTDNQMSPMRKAAMDADITIILKNASTASDFITENYADFNQKFTEKYANLVGTGDCLIDGEIFRKELAAWKAAQPPEKQEELQLVDNILWDIMDKTKKGQLYN